MSRLLATEEDVRNTRGFSDCRFIVSSFGELKMPFTFRIIQILYSMPRATRLLGFLVLVAGLYTIPNDPLEMDEVAGTHKPEETDQRRLYN